MTQLSPTYAELILALIRNQDCIVVCHTANPNGPALDNEAEGIERGSIEGANWSDPIDGHSGRMMHNEVPIEFGIADEVEEISWYSVLQETNDEWIYSKQLAAPQTTTIGNPVLFPAEALVIVGRGGS